MNTEVIIWVRESKNLTKGEKAVLNALASRENPKTKQLNPSIHTLCSDTGWGRSAVCEAISSLKLKGIIEITKGHRGSSNYKISIPKLLLLDEATSPPHGQVETQKTDQLTQTTNPQDGPSRPPDGPRSPPHGRTSPPDGHKVINEVKKEEIKERYDDLAVQEDSNSERPSNRRGKVGGLVFSLSQSRSQREPKQVGIQMDLVDKIEHLLSSNLELTEQLFFDEHGKPSPKAIFRTLAQREGNGGIEPSAAQLDAIKKIAVQWKIRNSVNQIANAR
ncbi:MAG: helix-turn-helix domain-containing protein [Pseudomonadota bacterium]